MNAPPEIVGQSRQYVTFSVGGESYAAEILTVREVVRTPEITRLPCPDAGVIGVVNVRGRILPVADAAQCLDLASTGANARVLIADTGGEPFGLLVDSVDGVVEIPDALVQPVPATWPGRKGFMSGLATVETQLFAVVQLDELIAQSGEARADSS